MSIEKKLDEALNVIDELVSYIEMTDVYPNLLASPDTIAKKYRKIHSGLVESKGGVSNASQSKTSSQVNNGSLTAFAYDKSGSPLSNVKGLTISEAKSIFYVEEVEDDKLMLMWKIKPNRSLPANRRAGSKSSGYVRYQGLFYKVADVIQMIAN